MPYFVNEDEDIPYPIFLDEEDDIIDENGLLAITRDITPERLEKALNWAIFPWHETDGLVYWYSPENRFVLFPDKLKISKSLSAFIRKTPYEIRYDTCFEKVIENCAKVPRIGQAGTWITERIGGAFIDLHKKGICHSVEVFMEDKLVGGLYGSFLNNKVFSGESMFSLKPNASKLALIDLCTCGKYDLIDCQTYTDYLASMGAEMIDKNLYLDKYLGDDIDGHQPWTDAEGTEF